MKRGRHWLALYFSSGDISFVAFLTEPPLIPLLRRDKDLVDKRVFIPGGTLKDCQRHVHIEDEDTTTLSNDIIYHSGNEQCYYI